MRLRRLDLTRFGRFTDHVLDFGSAQDGEPDFHLIVGSNEAGKSTLTSAVLDLLFGIGARTPYGFLHGYDTMQIGAALDLPSGPREVVRVKRGQARLRDASGQAIDEGLLTAALSGIDRDAYRMMFCLDEETLRLGGESILASQGELGQLLFSASAGLAAFGQTINELQETVDGFYKPRGRHTELATFKAKLDVLKARKDEINVLASSYAQLVQERDGNALRYDAALAELSRSKLRLDEIKRSIGAVPDLAEIRSLREQIAPLADLPEPPAAWADKLPDLISADGRLTAARDIAAREVQRLSQERDAIEIDQPVLALGAAIDALRDGEARYRSALDIAKRRSDLQTVQDSLADLLKRLERPASDEPATLVLTASTTGKLRGLIDRRSGIAERLQSTRREYQKAVDALASAQQVLKDLAPAGERSAISAGLQHALAQARASDHGTRVRAGQYAVSELANKLSDQQSALRPWTGDTDRLAALDAPASDRTADWKAAMEAIRHSLDRCDSEIENLGATTTELGAKIGAIKAATGLVDDETALKSRAGRDEAWQAHLSAMDRATAQAFEASLRHDDEITDVRVRQNDQAADLRQSVQLLATASAKLKRVEEMRRQGLERQSKLLREIGGYLLAMGLPPDMRLAELERWLARRASVLEIQSALRLAEANLGVAEEEGRTQLGRLRQAFAAAGIDPPPEASFETLLNHLQAVIDEDIKLQAELASARKAVGNLSAEKTARERDLAEAQAADAEWTQAWQSVLATCWLGKMASPPEPDEVNQILVQLAALPELISRRDDLIHRIEAMQADRDQFAQAVSSIMSNLELATDRDDALEAVAALRARLDLGRRNEQKRHGRSADLTKAIEALRAAEDAIALHHAETSKITAFFGVEGLIEVSAKLDQVKKRSQLQGQIETLKKRLIAACRCDTIEQAEEMLATVDQAQLKAEAASISVRIEDQEGETRDLHAKRIQADQALAGIGGDDAVARLDEERRTVLLELEEKAIWYLRLKLGIAAAHKALQVYRETHRTSMLQRASDAFRTITRGSYSGLSTQPDGDKEVLLGVVAAGGSRLASEMSTGTRAQLYLALRIAGYHEFARTRPSLPFIADDILETFDDFRSEEACRLFTEMAKTGQVIVATHHRHLIEISRQVCPGVRVHELPA